MFNFLERPPFGFWHHELHPDELKDHHEAKEAKDYAWVEGLHHRGEKQRQQCRENPVGEAAQRLTLRAMPVREDLGNEHPDDSALPNGMSGNKSKDTGRHDRKILREECPRTKAE